MTELHTTTVNTASNNNMILIKKSKQDKVPKEKGLKDKDKEKSKDKSVVKKDKDHKDRKSIKYHIHKINIHHTHSPVDFRYCRYRILFDLIFISTFYLYFRVLMIDSIFNTKYFPLCFRHKQNKTKQNKRPKNHFICALFCCCYHSKKKERKKVTQKCEFPQNSSFANSFSFFLIYYKVLYIWFIWFSFFLSFHFLRRN